MSHFEHEYVEFDELSEARPVPLGPKCIRCQCCGCEVVTRHYIELDIKSDPPRREKVLTLVKLGHYRRVPMALSDGTVINLHMCADCEKNEKIDFDTCPDTCDRIVAQIKNSMANEDRWAKKHEQDIQENGKRWANVKALKVFDSHTSLKDAVQRTNDLCEVFKKNGCLHEKTVEPVVSADVPKASKKKCKKKK